jgi:hypothetical protein
MMQLSILGLSSNYSADYGALAGMMQDGPGAGIRKQESGTRNHNRNEESEGPEESTGIGTLSS